MTALVHEAIAERVRARFAGVTAAATPNAQPFLAVVPADVVAVLRFLRDDPALRFDALMDLTAYDRLKYAAAATPGDAIVVVYLLFSYTHKHKVTLEVEAPRADCRLPTASGVWPAANYFEREVWDLFGVHFDGHPNLLRIMCPQDWEGHPLRKDYRYPDQYHGVPHLREGQHFEDGPGRTPAAAPAPAAKKGQS